MPTVTMQDGAQIFYKNWGPKNSQPIVLHHGWPLSADGAAVRSFSPVSFQPAIGWRT